MPEGKGHCQIAAKVWLFQAAVVLQTPQEVGVCPMLGGIQCNILGESERFSEMFHWHGPRQKKFHHQRSCQVNLVMRKHLGHFFCFGMPPFWGGGGGGAVFGGLVVYMATLVEQLTHYGWVSLIPLANRRACLHH